MIIARVLPLPSFSVRLRLRPLTEISPPFDFRILPRDAAERHLIAAMFLRYAASPLQHHFDAAISLAACRFRGFR